MNLEAIGISADFWAHPDVVRDWLRTDYDPATMPPLTVARVGVDPTPWLVGLESPPGEGCCLLIFGGFTRVEQVEAGLAAGE